MEDKTKQKEGYTKIKTHTHIQKQILEQCATVTYPFPTRTYTPVNSTMLLPTCVYIRVHLLLQQQWLTFSSTGDNAPYHHKQSIVCDVWMSVCVSALKQGNLIF